MDKLHRHPAVVALINAGFTAAGEVHGPGDGPVMPISARPGAPRHPPPDKPGRLKAAPQPGHGKPLGPDPVY